MDLCEDNTTGVGQIALKFPEKVPSTIEKHCRKGLKSVSEVIVNCAFGCIFPFQNEWRDEHVILLKKT